MAAVQNLYSIFSISILPSFSFQDILFGLVRKLFQSSKTELRRGNEEVPKVIIMSATLNHEKFSEFFSDCPVFEIPGRCFPVQNIFLDYVGVKDLQTPSYLKRVSNIKACLLKSKISLSLSYPIARKV